MYVCMYNQSDVPYVVFIYICTYIIYSSSDIMLIDALANLSEVSSFYVCTYLFVHRYIPY